MPTQRLSPKGLRASEFASRDSQGLLVCQNLRSAPEGLLAPFAVTVSAGMAAGMAAASPTIATTTSNGYRFFVFRTRIVCVTATAVYYVVFSGTDTWTFTNVTSSPGLEWSYILGENIVTDYLFATIAASWSYTPGAFTQDTGGGALRAASASNPTIQHTGLTIAAGTYTVVLTGTCSVAAGATNTIKATINTSGTERALSGIGAFTYTEDLVVGASSSVGVTVGATFAGEITSLLIYRKATSAGITGGYWHASDFGDVQVLHSDSSTVILTTGKAYLNNRVKAKTGCNFRGRLVLGNFDPTLGIPPELIAYWTARGDTPTQYGASTVWWSGLGLSDHMQFYNPDSVLTSAGFYEDCLKSGMQGWQDMPFLGAVKCVKALQSCVLVYGENGVAQLTPTEGGPFGVRKLLNVGVGGRDCVAGSDTEHLMVARNGELWRIRDGSPLEISNLGYREFGVALTHSTLVTGYNPLLREFHIFPAGAAYQYVLTDVGLTTVNDRLLGAVAVNGVTYTPNAYTDAELGIAPKVSLETDDMDFGSRGVKTLTNWVVGLKSPTPANVRLWVKFSLDDTTPVHTTQPSNVVAGGRVFHEVTGVNFRVCLEAVSHADVARLEFIQFDVEEGGKTRLHTVMLGGT